MTYREPDDPSGDLPDLVGGSGRRAARNVALVGLACLVGGGVIYFTTVVALATVAGALSMVLGVILLVAGAVMFVRHR